VELRLLLGMEVWATSGSICDLDDWNCELDDAMFNSQVETVARAFNRRVKKIIVPWMVSSFGSRIACWIGHRLVSK
jgi:hypothetical protein